MKITTLIGLTEEQYNHAKNEREHEYFQLEEIKRHYEARMRRRRQKHDKIWALLRATPDDDFEKWNRRWAKIKEFDRHDERDRVRWHAVLDRCIKNSTRWNEMMDESKAYAEQAALRQKNRHE